MKNKEKEILIYLYRFRFLTREQIQRLTDQKFHSLTISRLNDLLKNNFIKRFYNPNLVNSPAVYSLDNQGRKYLIDNYKDLKLNKTVLDKVWRINKLTTQFRNHCLTLADVYISLKDTVAKLEATVSFYTKNDLQNIKYLITPHPDAYFYVKDSSGFKKYYFLDIFDFYTNNLKLKKRIQQHLDYFDDNYWQDETGCNFPEVIFVTSDERSYSYLNWYLPKVLEDNDDVNFYLISKQQIKINGFNKASLKKMVTED